MGVLMGDTVDVDTTKLEAGLKLVRRRRLWLWGIIGVYVPAIWLTLQINSAFRVVFTVFVVWVVLLIAAVLVSALAVCPRCGNYFHLHGMALLYLRKCLHCQLHVNADKTARSKK
jgi:hypothetical protein